MDPVEKQSPTHTQAINKIIWHLDLAFWGMCGSIAREGLIALTGYEQWGPLWANVAGCIVMGFHENYIHDPIYAPKVGVGFCGSFTSFSSLIVSLFLYSTTPQPKWRTDGYGVMAFMALLIIEVACSISSLFFGRHLEKLARTYHVLIRPNYATIQYLGAAIGLAAWIACLVIACTVSTDRNWPLIAVFTPFGVYCRFYASKLNRPEYRIGTFTVNMIGTILACIFNILQHPDIGASVLQIQVLKGLSDGFCGSLTTVSSLVLELTNLPLPKAYSYGILSFGLGFCFAVLIIGSFDWTR